MLTIQASEFSNRFELSDGELRIIEPFAKTPSAQKNKFSWDNFLDAAKEGLDDAIGTSIGIGIGYTVLQKLIGSDDQWQKDVSNQLKEITLKLDQVIASIDRLQKLIMQNDINSARAYLESNIGAYMETVEQIMSAVRRKKVLEDPEKSQLVNMTPFLLNSINQLLTYKRNDYQFPFAISLYAVAQAGCISLKMAGTLINSELYIEGANAVSVKLSEWADFVTEDAKVQAKDAEKEAAFLQTYPRKAPIAYANVESDFSWTTPASYTQNPFLVMANIEGGLDRPFVFTGLTKGIEGTVFSFENNDFLDFYQQNIKDNEFPAPYMFAIIGPPPSKYALTKRMLEMVDSLNGRRDALLKQLNSISQLNDLTASLKGGIVRMQQLVPTKKAGEA